MPRLRIDDIDVPIEPDRPLARVVLLFTPLTLPDAIAGAEADVAESYRLRLARCARKHECRVARNRATARAKQGSSHISPAASADVHNAQLLTTGR